MHLDVSRLYAVNVQDRGLELPPTVMRGAMVLLPPALLEQIERSRARAERGDIGFTGPFLGHGLGDSPGLFIGDGKEAAAAVETAFQLQTELRGAIFSSDTAEVYPRYSLCRGGAYMGVGQGLPPGLGKVVEKGMRMILSGGSSLDPQQFSQTLWRLVAPPGGDGVVRGGPRAAGAAARLGDGEQETASSSSVAIPVGSSFSEVEVSEILQQTNWERLRGRGSLSFRETWQQQSEEDDEQFILSVVDPDRLPGAEGKTWATTSGLSDRGSPAPSTGGEIRRAHSTPPARPVPLPRRPAKSAGPDLGPLPQPEQEKQVLIQLLKQHEWRPAGSDGKNGDHKNVKQGDSWTHYVLHSELSTDPWSRGQMFSHITKKLLGLKPHFSRRSFDLAGVLLLEKVFVSLGLGSAFPDRVFEGDLVVQLSDVFDLVGFVRMLYGHADVFMAAGSRAESLVSGEGDHSAAASAGEDLPEEEPASSSSSQTKGGEDQRDSIIAEQQASQEQTTAEEAWQQQEQQSLREQGKGAGYVKECASLPVEPILATDFQRLADTA